MSDHPRFVWVFSGKGGQFPSGVFSSRTTAEKQIKARNLQGTLTCYPVDALTYDWAIAEGAFMPKRDSQRSREFIQTFSSASQEHFHYDDEGD